MRGFTFTCCCGGDIFDFYGAPHANLGDWDETTDTGKGNSLCRFPSLSDSGTEPQDSDGLWNVAFTSWDAADPDVNHNVHATLRYLTGTNEQILYLLTDDEDVNERILVVDVTTTGATPTLASLNTATWSTFFPTNPWYTICQHEDDLYKYIPPPSQSISGRTPPADSNQRVFPDITISKRTSGGTNSSATSSPSTTISEANNWRPQMLARRDASRAVAIKYEWETSVDGSGGYNLDSFTARIGIGDTDLTNVRATTVTESENATTPLTLVSGSAGTNKVYEVAMYYPVSFDSINGDEVMAFVLGTDIVNLSTGDVISIGNPASRDGTKTWYAKIDHFGTVRTVQSYTLNQVTSVIPPPTYPSGERFPWSVSVALDGTQRYFVVGQWAFNAAADVSFYDGSTEEWSHAYDDADMAHLKVSDRFAYGEVEIDVAGTPTSTGVAWDYDGNEYYIGQDAGTEVDPMQLADNVTDPGVNYFGSGVAAFTNWDCIAYSDDIAPDVALMGRFNAP